MDASGAHRKTYLEALVETEPLEFLLKIDSIIHILNRVNDDVDELHAGNLGPYASTDGASSRAPSLTM